MAFAKEKWAEIRSLYETGEFDSVDDAYAAWEKKVRRRKNYGKIPSLRTVRDHCTKEQWDKGRNEDAILAQTRQLTEAAFAQVGLPRSKRVRLMAEGAQLGDTEGPVVQRIAELMAELSGKKWSIEAIVELRQYIDRFLNDKKTALGYLKEINEILGEYAPKKIEKSGTTKHEHSFGFLHMEGDEADRLILAIAKRLGIKVLVHGNDT